MKVKRIDHVGIAVGETAKALPFYDLLGLQVGESEEVPDQGLKISFLPAGETQLELLEPSNPDSTVSKFIEKRGEGIHHICFAVEDLGAAIKELLDAGVQMIDRVPRSGNGGHRIAFVHPKSTHGVLVELVEEGE